MEEKKIPIDDCKKIQLQILDVVADFCKKNKINYWLNCGTLIGSIRHKGYIPWDDDIDLGMLRKDFNRFGELFNLENNRYKFYCYENNNNFLYAYGKVLDTNTVLYEPDRKGNKLSVNIDIFVYDNVPNNDKEIKKMYMKRDIYTLLNTIRISHNPRGNIFRKILVHMVRFILGIFPKDFFVKRIVKNAKKYSNIKSDQVGNFTGYERILAQKELVINCIEGEFEGKKYNIPKGYDKWLRLFYDDYMQLPPEEQRVTHHKFEAYYDN